MASPSGAQNRLDLRDVPLSDVVALYYKTQNDSPYVICPEVTADIRRVSVRTPAATTRKALQALLSASGYSLQRRGGVDVVCKPQTTSYGVTASYGPPPELAAVMRPRIDALPSQGAAIPTGSPLDPGLASTPGAYLVPNPPTTSAPAMPIPVPSAPLVARVYSTRYQPASVVFSAVSALGADDGLGKFALPSATTTRTDDGKAAQTVSGGQAVGDVILWRGPDSLWGDVLALLRRLDAPPQTAVMEVIAIAVQNANTDRDALGIVGDALGFGFSLGSAASSATFRLGGVSIGIDSLRSRRDLKVLQQWRGDVESGRRVDVRNGGQTPVVSAITESEGGRVTRGVQYQPTGVSLSVDPVVLEEMVRAHVVIEENSVVASSDTPTFETRRLESDVRVCFGCVTIISRLATDISDRGKSKLFGFLPVERRSATVAGRVVYVVSAAQRPWEAIPVVEPVKVADPKEKAPGTSPAPSSANTGGPASTRPPAAPSSSAVEALRDVRPR